MLFSRNSGFPLCMSAIHSISLVYSTMKYSLLFLKKILSKLYFSKGQCHYSCIRNPKHLKYFQKTETEIRNCDTNDSTICTLTIKDSSLFLQTVRFLNYNVYIAFQNNHSGFTTLYLLLYSFYQQFTNSVYCVCDI